MLLSEGQMSDFKGAALMLSDLPGLTSFWPTGATMQTGSVMRWPNAKSPLHPVQIQSENSDLPRRSPL